MATMGLNGISIWGDFIDLQAKGPVPWRKEIGEGIENCAKMVIFLDKQWLLSFNCLQVRGALTRRPDVVTKQP